MAFQPFERLGPSARSLHLQVQRAQVVDRTRTVVGATPVWRAADPESWEIRPNTHPLASAVVSALLNEPGLVPTESVAVEGGPVIRWGGHRPVGTPGSGHHSLGTAHDATEQTRASVLWKRLQEHYHQR